MIPHNQTKIAKLIVQLRIVLQDNFNSWQDVADRISMRIGRRVRRSEVLRAAAIVRKNQHKLYDWNIPHIGPGAMSSDGLDEGRIHRVIRGVRRTSGQRRHRKRGTLQLWRMNHTMLANQVRMHEEEREVATPAIAEKMEKYIVMLKAATYSLSDLIVTLAEEVRQDEQEAA